MGRVKAELQLPGVATSDAEELWYDTRRWPTFVDGFGHVSALDEGWPRAPGAVVVWDSKPGGRGRVLERVVELRGARRPDRRGRGRRRSTAARRSRSGPDATDARVTLELDYAIKQDRGVPAVVDFLFVRRPMRDSLKRTLARFEREVRAPR